MHPRGLASSPPLATSSSAPAGWIQSASPAATPHSATAPRGSVPPTRWQRPPPGRTGLFFFSCSHCCSSYWRRWCSRHNFAVQFVFCLNHLKEFTFPIRIKVKFVKEIVVLRPHKRGDNMTVDLISFLFFLNQCDPKWLTDWAYQTHQDSNYSSQGQETFTHRFLQKPNGFYKLPRGGH